MMRQQVRGLTVVRPDGVVLDTTGRPRKDNTGFDMTSLLAGSEGTLGVITAVEVALHPAERALLRRSCSAMPDRVPPQRRLGRCWPAERVCSPLRSSTARAWSEPRDPWRSPIPWPALGSGCCCSRSPTERPERAWPRSPTRWSRVATDGPDRARLWALRERQTELYAARVDSAPEKLDVSVRISHLDELVRRTRQMVTDPTQVGFFGHVLDGNLHVQLNGVPPLTAGRVLALVAELGGSISAEHGIGRMKAGQLHLARTAEEVAWMRAIKAAVDPDGLLNAGRPVHGASERGGAGPLTPGSSARLRMEFDALATSAAVEWHRVCSGMLATWSAVPSSIAHRGRQL